MIPSFKNLVQLAFKSNLPFARKVRVVNKLKQAQLDNLSDDENEQINLNIIKELQQAKEETQVEEQVDQEKLKMIRETILYEGDDPYYEKLVQRPGKGMVWGLGGQLVAQTKSSDSQFGGDIDKIIKFLEISQIKDVTFTDLHEFEKYSFYRYGIVGTMYSTVHGWKVGKELMRGFKMEWNKIQENNQQEDLEHANKVGVQNRNRKLMRNIKNGSKPYLSGSKDDEWIMVGYNDIMIHLFNEETRVEVSIEDKWRKPIDEEQMEEYNKIIRGMKKNKGLYEPLD